MSVLVPSNLICMVQETLKRQLAKTGELMNRLISAISDLVSKALTLAVTCSVIALLAGEIRLAALRKASQGSSKLSGFTQQMTGMNLDFLN